MTDFMTTSSILGEKKRTKVVIFHVNHLYMKCEAFVSLNIAADGSKIAADDIFYNVFIQFLGEKKRI